MFRVNAKEILVFKRNSTARVALRLVRLKTSREEFIPPEDFHSPFTAVTAPTLFRRISAAPAGPSASGHGTILLQNAEGKTVRRQFSFSARVLADGTVQGSAVIHNPSFDPKYDAQFDITCLQVVGNRASMGGSVRKSSDPVFNDEFDAAFFTVFDVSKGGQGDTISEVFFDNVVEPSTCQFIGADDFPQIPIESGNVLVKP